jgi:hypothetical protein
MSSTSGGAPGDSRIFEGTNAGKASTDVDEVYQQISDCGQKKRSIGIEYANSVKNAELRWPILPVALLKGEHGEYFATHPFAGF